MFFAGKAIIYLKEERGRAAQNNFFKTMNSTLNRKFVRTMKDSEETATAFNVGNDRR